MCFVIASLWPPCWLKGSLLVLVGPAAAAAAAVGGISVTARQRFIDSLSISCIDWFPNGAGVKGELTGVPRGCFLFPCDAQVKAAARKRTETPQCCDLEVHCVCACICQARAMALSPQIPRGEPGHFRVARVVEQQPVGFSFPFPWRRPPLKGWMEPDIWFASGNTLRHTHGFFPPLKYFVCDHILGVQNLITKTWGGRSVNVSDRKVTLIRD